MAPDESRKGSVASFVAVLVTLIVAGVVVKNDARIAAALGNSNLALGAVFALEAALAAALVLALSWLGRAVGASRVEHRVRRIEGLMPRDAETLEDLVKGAVAIEMVELRGEFKKALEEHDESIKSWTEEKLGQGAAKGSE